ncbi:MAG: DUF5696 domain-containing protein [Treponema sp.]|nr:DUF5696 domain-containing protein [Treponema sp.]
MVLLSLTLAIAGSATYFPTIRDTLLPPPRAVPDDREKSAAYELLGQFGDLVYYFRADRDIIMIEDLVSGYIWKTGLDAPFGQDLDRIIAAAQTDEERMRAAEPREVRLNATYTGFANSLLTVEFYDETFNLNMVSSSARQGSRSELVKISDSHFRLDAHFTTLELQVSLHFHLSSRGISYRIYDHEISGPGQDRMAAIIITPFLGAAGGVREYFNHETGEYGPQTPVPMTPGYAFVPDGSGALIRYQDHTVSINRYVGQVFGDNPAEATLFYDDTVHTVRRKEPLMPVFGVSIGQDQKAFVAWADQGDEHMEIIMSPKGNTTNYNYIYPRFIFNRPIHQVYNRARDGFFRLFPERHRYDIAIDYHFLRGEDADYVGMALAYRNHLISNGTLSPGQLARDGQIPVRTDFIMGDVKRSVIGFSNVVTTHARDVGVIVRDLLDHGIGSINGGLLGFQDGGITTGNPGNINFTRHIGSRRDFQQLFSEASSLNVDLSFAQDYTTINRHQMNLPRNQAYHMNRWGLRARDNNNPSLPVQEISFARPQRSADWFNRQTREAARLGASSHTASGMTSQLLSHWGRVDPITTKETIALYQETFANSPLPLNAVAPNKYLWSHIDRFLQIPVFPTQYIIQTDTVPFLQMVLNGTMEMYGPYSNFSFFTQRDVLRMIDYNVYPAFVLTYGPAYLLSSTNSLRFFSTEYDVYRDIIIAIHGEVSAALGPVKGLEWIDRRVLADGVILNEYSGGIRILINYTNDAYSYGGQYYRALSATLIRGVP